MKWYDLVPVISYLLLGGKCRSCGERISWRYPFVEMLTAFLFYFCYVDFGLNIDLLRNLVLISFLIVISFIDIDHKRIPNVLTYGGILVGLIWYIACPWQSNLSAVLGFAIGGGFLLLLTIISRGGMGMGDVKLAAMLGLFLGWPNILFALGIAFVSGAIIGVLLIMLGIKKRKDYIPFGPFLALGAVVMISWGEAILKLYGIG